VVQVTRVANYTAWLHKEANLILGDPAHPLHDDLVQEGRIAMWKKERQGKGDQAGYMTYVAKQRMRNVGWNGEKAFGGIKVPVREVKPDTSLDAYEPWVAEVLTPAQADTADLAMMAYHEGEIYRAIEKLPPGQRTAVLTYMNDGKMTDCDFSAFYTAKKKLAVELEHLREGL
jgi:DNA-directed RNA polymerase specialized sigma24 family protein